MIYLIYSLSSVPYHTLVLLSPESLWLSLSRIRYLPSCLGSGGHLVAQDEAYVFGIHSIHFTFQGYLVPPIPKLFLKFWSVNLLAFYWPSLIMSLGFKFLWPVKMVTTWHLLSILNIFLAIFLWLLRFYTFFFFFPDPMNFSLPGSSVHGYTPGKNTGVGCHFLLHTLYFYSFLTILLGPWKECTSGHTFSLP